MACFLYNYIVYTWRYKLATEKNRKNIFEYDRNSKDIKPNIKENNLLKQSGKLLEFESKQSIDQKKLTSISTLYRIPNITPDFVTLLQENKIYSSKALAERKPRKLYFQLLSINKDKKIYTPSLKIKFIREIIDYAKRNKEFVFK